MPRKHNYVVGFTRDGDVAYGAISKGKLDYISLLSRAQAFHDAETEYFPDSDSPVAVYKLVLVKKFYKRRK